MADPSRPKTTQAYVLDSLRRLILSGELPAGSPVRQEDAARRLGVSRPPVREALQVLENEGHLTYAPYRGFTVVDRSQSELEEVYELRALLESEAVRQSVPLYTPPLLHDLADLHERMVRLVDGSDLPTLQDHNRAFHFRLMEPCGKRRMLAMIAQLWDATTVYRSVYYANADYRDHVIRDHAEIVRLAQASDTESLVAALDRHREHAIDALRSATPN